MKELTRDEIADLTESAHAVGEALLVLLLKIQTFASTPVEVDTATLPPPSTKPVPQSDKWLTLRQAAEYANRHTDTLRRACREFETSRNRRGLKNFQRVAYGNRLVHLEDLAVWMAGEKPNPGRRKPRYELP